MTIGKPYTPAHILLAAMRPGRWYCVDDLAHRTGYHRDAVACGVRRVEFRRAVVGEIVPGCNTLTFRLRTAPAEATPQRGVASSAGQGSRDTKARASEALEG